MRRFIAALVGGVVGGVVGGLVCAGLYSGRDVQQVDPADALSEDEEALIRLKNRFYVGDTLEALSVHHMPCDFRVESILNEAGEYQEAAPHPNQILYVPCPVPLEMGDMLRRVEPSFAD